MIVDGVSISEAGETFDFGTLPLAQADRLEFVRGAQSTLYGSDAMTSVVQVWTRTGSTSVPELRFGADGGNFGTANGYASLAGTHGRFDYNFFGDQFNSNGQGVNDAYSDSLQGANAGAAITDRVGLRVRVRHSNSHTGLPGSGISTAMRPFRHFQLGTRSQTLCWEAPNLPSPLPRAGNIASRHPIISIAITTTVRREDTCNFTSPLTTTSTSITWRSNIRATTRSAPGRTQPLDIDRKRKRT